MFGVTSPRGGYMVRGDMGWQGEGGGWKIGILGWRKGWCKKNDTTIVKMNITEFKGYICILID